MQKQSGFTYFEVICMAVIFFVLGIVSLSAYVSANAKVRDRQRVSEVLQLQQALKSYYQQNLDYPNSNNGFPLDFDQYIKWPNPPSPADGLCSEEQNRYHYTKLNSTDYTIAFCLGDSAEGYRAGIRKANPIDGIR